MSEIQLDPRIKKAIPWEAVKARQMKKAVKVDDNAVPKEDAKNKKVLQRYTCTMSALVGSLETTNRSAAKDVGGWPPETCRNPHKD